MAKSLGKVTVSKVCSNGKRIPNYFLRLVDSMRSYAVDGLAHGMMRAEVCRARFSTVVRAHALSRWWPGFRSRSLPRYQGNLVDLYPCLTGSNPAHRCQSDSVRELKRRFGLHNLTVTVGVVVSQESMG